MVGRPKKTRGPIWLEPPFLVGLVITLAVLGLAVWSLSVGEVCNADGSCISKWGKLKASPPNEIGDALAGFAGTLAFVWLIVTVWLQATELREQREEFEKMADAQEAQVGLLVKQGEIFADEQRQRDESRAENLFDEKLNSLIIAISETMEQGLRWSFSNAPIDDEYGNNGQIISWTIGNRQDESLVIDDAIIAIRRRLIGSHEHLWELSHTCIDDRLPEKSNTIPELLDRIHKIIQMEADLSQPQKERLMRMRLDEIIFNLNSLYNTPEFWKDNA